MMESMSKQNDIYYTIEKIESSEIKIKGSRFIATASPVDSKVTALEFLDGIRAKYHDARHHCYAFRIGKDGLVFRAVDDGEPSGSGGKPILFTLTKQNLCDIIVVVTRYFGGTKLGVGGLSRAYSQATNLALEKCKIKAVYITKTIKVFCIYEDLDAVKKIINEFAVTFKEDFHDAIEIIAEIPNSRVENFINEITSKTKGRAGAVLEHRTEK